MIIHANLSSTVAGRNVRSSFEIDTGEKTIVATLSSLEVETLQELPTSLRINGEGFVASDSESNGTEKVAVMYTSIDNEGWTLYVYAN